MKRDTTTRLSKQLNKKIVTTSNAWEYAEELDPSYVVGRNVKWYSHSGKMVCQFLKIPNMQLVTIQLSYYTLLTRAFFVSGTLHFLSSLNITTCYSLP